MTRYTDFLMLISPPEKVIKEIDRYKRASLRVIGEFESMHSKAHISITHQYRCRPYLVQHAIVQMEKRLSEMPPIELQINGFAAFQHGETAKTIYARLANNPQVENWFFQLKKQMKIQVKNFTPHITIAKKIPNTSFNRLWPHFEKCSYQDSFLVDRLTILKRETYDEYARWEIYKELYFDRMGDNLKLK